MPAKRKDVEWVMSLSRMETRSAAGPGLAGSPTSSCLWSACITPVATQVPPRLCYREVTTHLFTLDWLLLHRAPSSESPLCEVNSEERTDNAACKLVTSVTGNATQVKARRCHDATLSSCSTNHICRPCRVSR